MSSDFDQGGQIPFALGPTSRRAFIKAAALGGLGAGFALASSPLLAQAIHTDFAGIQAGEISFDSGGLAVPAYCSRPANATKKLPIIIVASEIFGVHEYIADVTRRLAKLGYLAIAPEFFTRAGEPSELGTVGEIMTKIVARTPDQQVLSDIEAALRWAGAHNGDLTRVGINGFCWGGRITWLACQKLSSIHAGVAWYGRLLNAKNATTPEQPVELAQQTRAPVLGLYGGQDEGIKLADIEQMKAALASPQATAAARLSQFEIYPEAPHAFHADYRQSYREAAAKDGWRKALDWFKTHGVPAT